jgi:hypothetical protein
MIKQVCIETLDKPLPQIHSVPALLTLPDKKFMFGKNVFDYLLLPGKGRLVTSSPANDMEKRSGSGPGTGTSTGTGNVSPNSDPIAFTIGARGLSDNYAPIESIENDYGNDDRVYNWTNITDLGSAPDVNVNQFNQEVKVKKELPSLSDFQSQRSLELTQNDLNNNTLPATISGRD